jgi:hypothetical protein
VAWHRFITRKRMERIEQIIIDSAAGCIAWSAALCLAQPLGLLTRVSSSTPIAGPLLGIATVASAAVACGEASRTVVASRWGLPRFGAHGIIPPKSAFLDI